MSIFSRILAATAQPMALTINGEAVTYSRGAADPADITAIWSDEPLSVWVRESDLNGVRPQVKDVFRRDGSTFVVIEPLPRAIDGGLTILLRQIGHRATDT